MTFRIPVSAAYAVALEALEAKTLGTAEAEESALLQAMAEVSAASAASAHAALVACPNGYPLPMLFFTAQSVREVPRNLQATEKKRIKEKLTIYTHSYHDK
jgi:hypothetical protein